MQVAAGSLSGFMAVFVVFACLTGRRKQWGTKYYALVCIVAWIIRITKPDNLHWAAMTAMKFLTCSSCRLRFRKAADAEVSQQLLKEEEDKLQGAVKRGAAKTGAGAGGLTATAAGKRKVVASRKLSAKGKASAPGPSPTVPTASPTPPAEAPSNDVRQKASAPERKEENTTQAKRKTKAGAGTSAPAANGARPAPKKKAAAGAVASAGRKATLAPTPKPAAADAEAAEADLPEVSPAVPTDAEVAWKASVSTSTASGASDSDMSTEAVADGAPPSRGEDSTLRASPPQGEHVEQHAAQGDASEAEVPCRASNACDSWDVFLDEDLPCRWRRSFSDGHLQELERAMAWAKEDAEAAAATAASDADDEAVEEVSSVSRGAKATLAAAPLEGGVVAQPHVHEAPSEARGGTVLYPMWRGVWLSHAIDLVAAMRAADEMKCQLMFPHLDRSVYFSEQYFD